MRFHGDKMIAKKIVIEKSKVLIESDNNSESNIFLFHRYLTYILYKIFDGIEKKSVGHKAKCDLENYSYSINNANDETEIIIPEELREITQGVIDSIISNNELRLDFNGEGIYFDADGLNDAFESLYEDYLSDIIEDIFDSEVELLVSKEYGNLFRDKICKKIYENNNVILETISQEIKHETQCKIYYLDEILVSTERLEDKRLIQFDNEMESCVSFWMEDLNSLNSRELKMYFPFWRKGDLLEVSICNLNGELYFCGKHIDSGIISKIKL